MVRSLVCVSNGDPRIPLGASNCPFQLRDVPLPPCGENDVHVRVYAASLNFADALVVQGLYQEKPKLPFVGGGEAAGVVVAVGSKVSALSAGDAVLVLCLRGFGAFADVICVPASDAVRLPARVPLAQAAALAVAYGTAHVALSHRARLRPGHRVLVLGGAGGVGLAAVSIAKLLGARVAAVATGADKLAAVRAAGAELAIETPTSPGGLRKAMAAWAPRGVDVVIDPIGGPLSAEAAKCMGWGGQLVVIGFLAGVPPLLPANALLVKNQTIHGLYWGSYAANEPAVLRDSLRTLLGWVGDGKMEVHVSHAVPLIRAHEGFGALMGRKAVGKVVLILGEEAELPHVDSAGPPRPMLAKM